MTLIERLKVKLKATALDGNAIPLNHSTVAEIIQTLERQEEHIRVKNAHLSVASTDKGRMLLEIARKDKLLAEAKELIESNTGEGYTTSDMKLSIEYPEDINTWLAALEEEGKK